LRWGDAHVVSRQLRTDLREDRRVHPPALRRSFSKRRPGGRGARGRFLPRPRTAQGVCAAPHEPGHGSRAVPHLAHAREEKCKTREVPAHLYDSGKVVLMLVEDEIRMCRRLCQRIQKDAIDSCASAMAACFRDEVSAMFEKQGKRSRASEAFGSTNHSSSSAAIAADDVGFIDHSR
jgi:hypothetical protein